MPTRSILLIDDDVDTINLLKTLFLYEQISTDTLDGLPETSIIDQLKMRQYAALIIDVRLDGLDGIHLVRQVRRELMDQSPVIIMMSGLALSHRCLEAGADHFFQKPFDPLALLQAIPAASENPR